MLRSAGIYQAPPPMSALCNLPLPHQIMSPAVSAECLGNLLGERLAYSYDTVKICKLSLNALREVL